MRTQLTLGAALMLLLSMLAACATPQTTEGPAAESPQGATVSLTPASGTHSVGTTFDADVVVDTGEYTVNTVDVVLSYDPELLAVVDAVDAQEGTQVTAHDAFEHFALNDVRDGEIRLGAATTDHVGPGSVTLATITFEVLNAGAASVDVAYEPGSHSDTDVFAVETVTDVLSDVSGAQFTLTE